MAANRGLHDVFASYAAEGHDRLDVRIEPVLNRLLARGQQAGVVRADIVPADLGVILQMLATVSDIPADGQEMLFRRYLTLILAGLRPAGEPLPGTAPSPAQAREAMRPGRLLRG